MTKIPWTEETWNPVVGCTKVSAGCKNCYAEKMAWRLKYMHKAKYEDDWGGYYGAVVDDIGKWNGKVLCREDVLDKPLHWKKPRKIFVCSMGDLFHEKVSFEFQCKVFNIVEKCPQHIFQVLTKRPENMYEFFAGESGAGLNQKHLPNLWLGTSLSTQADADKNIPILLDVPAAVRFVSLEPMLEAPDLEKYLIDINDKPPEFSGLLRNPPQIKKIHWMIIGCESGPKARLCSMRDVDWMIEQGKFSRTPMFLKQIPLNGKCNKNPDDWPEKYRRPNLRRYPK